MSFEFQDMYKDGFKIVKWYKCHGCKFFDNLVCLRNKDMVVLKMWKNGEVSDNMIFQDPDESDLKKINAKVTSYLKLANSFEVKQKEQIIDIMSAIGIDSNFVQ